MPAVPIAVVNVLNTPYEIIVEPGVIARAGETIRKVVPSRVCGVFTDETIARLYLPALQKSLAAVGYEVVTAIIPAGEAHKTLESVKIGYDAFLAKNFERSTPIISFGGGVVGDITGFIAATLLRGVPFVQIPTTLLAMVDASVGGKTGIDHPAGKNLIGAFHQPRAVLIDPELLKSLPPRELRSGLAECIKHDIIRDADHFATLEHSIDRALKLDIAYLTDLIAHNVAIKARVVEADPFEKTERAHLNFGHTFGHAIETVSQYAYAHGECVALGMIAASRMASRLKMIDDKSVDRITCCIAAAGLPTGRMSLPIPDVLDAMKFDKKVKDGKIRFVLPDRIGHVVVRDDVPMDLVRDALLSVTG